MSGEMMLPAMAAGEMMELAKVCEMLVRSSFCGVKKPEDALWIVATGRSLGIDPVTSLRGIHVIGGKPVLSADLMAAVAMRHPECVCLQVVEMTPQRATVKVQRRGWPEPSMISFSMDDAKNADLLRNPTWKKYPADMCKARAIARAARAAFPDALLGVYVEGELTEEPVEAAPVVAHPDALDVTPPKQAAPKTERPAQSKPESGEVIDPAHQSGDDLAQRPRHEIDGDSWSTPEWLIDLCIDVVGPFDVDPATHELARKIVAARTYYTAQTNGLDKSWWGNVWLNPPYSTELIRQFASKALAEWARGDIANMFVLTNTSHSVGWWKDLASKASAVVLLSKRVSFWHPDPNAICERPRYDNTLFYFGDEAGRVAELFEDHGLVLTIYKPSDDL